MRLTNFFLFLLVYIQSPLSMAYDCSNTRQIERSVDAKKLTKLSVDAGAGSLEIEGQKGLNTIEIDARLCAEDEDDLDDMDVVARMRTDNGTIKTDIPRGSGWNDNNHKSIDLVLRVPARLELEVNDSSGKAVVTKVRALEMEDSSGALVIAEINGDVSVEDSSGSVDLENIQGRVVISDSSGAIRARDIGKTLLVESDSSGEIDAKRVGGDFIVDRDSSGSISAKDVAGDFIVRRDGSGGIYFKNIGGKGEIPERKRKN